MRVAKETHKFLIGGVCAESAKKMKFFFSPYLTEEYPNYWGTMPMHMFTVLEQINFESKTVRPVCTHEGSGMGKSEAGLKKCCSGAVIKKGLAIQGSSVGRCDDVLKEWLES